MEALKKTWRYNFVEYEYKREDFEFIYFKELKSQWVVAGYSFIDTPSPALYGAHGGYHISFADFIKTKPKNLPIEIYEEIKAIILEFNQAGPPKST